MIRTGKHILSIVYPRLETTYLAHFYKGGKIRVVSNIYGERHVVEDRDYAMSLIRCVILGR